MNVKHIDLWLPVWFGHAASVSGDRQMEGEGGKGVIPPPLPVPSSLGPSLGRRAQLLLGSLSLSLDPDEVPVSSFLPLAP